MPTVDCQVVRWVGGGFPGFVEAQLVDAQGRTWTLIDKESIFGVSVGPSGPLPVAARLRCSILGPPAEHGGRDVMTIDIAHPDGVEAEDGVTQFQVPIDAVHDWPPDSN